MIKNKTITIILSFPNGKSKELKNYQIGTTPKKGDVLQWNGVKYPILEVIFHQKEGFAPYIELKTDYSDCIENDYAEDTVSKDYVGLKKDIFSWGKYPQNPEHICMYCGREGSTNPSDYGLHFNDEDVFGNKYVCPLCDEMITQSNRMFKSVLEELQNNNKSSAKAILETTISNLSKIRDTL